MSNVIWKPQPKQTEFMRRPEFEVLFGGAAGGGKSMALMFEALRQVDKPGYRGIIFRRTFPQLEALISETIKWYPRVFPKARYNATEKRWTFPSGGVVLFGHMQHENDMFSYQGRPFDFAGFDELTHFLESQYTYIKNSRMRPTEEGTRVYVRDTANPGGVGNAWVKQRFISPAPPMTTLWEYQDVTFPDGSVHSTKRDRLFVPATVFDNPALLKNFPGYIDSLAGLPEAERNALLYGDWDSYAGQYFHNWKNIKEHYKDRRWTHVIDPFTIPRHWLRFRSFDFGYARPFSVGWHVVDEDGKLYRIRELYGSTGKANEGLRWNPVEIAKHISEIENSDPNLKGHQIYGVADPSIFDESRGQSVAALMERHPYYISFSPGDNHRIAGWQQLQWRLAFDENGECMLQVFNTCKDFIRTFPSLVHDDKHVEDLDTEGEDHAADEQRYLCMEYPISPRLPITPAPKQIDPLDRRTTVFI